MPNYRTREERITELEKSIEWHEQHIENLKAKIQKLKMPPKPKGRVGIATVIRKAKEQGISAERLLKMIEETEKTNG